MKQRISRANGRKRYTEMTTAELRSATKEYDAPTRGNRLPGRALTEAQRARFERAQKRGRPRVGRGAKVISMSMERGLLARADMEARAEGISRAELVARALEAMLKRAG